MAKIDKLLNKTVRDGEAKKWVVVVGILVGVLIASCGIYWYMFIYADVDVYIHDIKQTPTLYEFYEGHKLFNETSAFFLGNSVIGYSVYPPAINSYLSELGYDISAYNLHMSGAGYDEYILQLDNIIDSHPNLVVIGVSYMMFMNETSQSELERLSLFYNQPDIKKEYFSSLNDDALSKLESPSTFFKYKKYISSSIQYKFGDETQYTNDYFTDPIGEKYRIYFDKSRYNETKVANFINNTPGYYRDIGTSDNNAKFALKYLSDHLNNSGIGVVYVSMPLHPLASKKVSYQARKNYYDYLNTTGYRWYDLETGYDLIHFRDDAHMSFEGAKTIAPAYANIIIQELG